MKAGGIHASAGFTQHILLEVVEVVGGDRLIVATSPER